MDILHFIHSSVDRYLECFHILAIVNNDRVSRGELITLGDPYFSTFGYIYRSNIAGFMVVIFLIV